MCDYVCAFSLCLIRLSCIDAFELALLLGELGKGYSHGTAENALWTRETSATAANVHILHLPFDV